jgi:hypothetical protein
MGSNPSTTKKKKKKERIWEVPKDVCEGRNLKLKNI